MEFQSAASCSVVGGGPELPHNRVVGEPGAILKQRELGGLDLTTAASQARSGDVAGSGATEHGLDLVATHKADLAAESPSTRHPEAMVYNRP